MKLEILNKLFEVREYFLAEMPDEDTRERKMLEFLDDIIDYLEK